MKKSSKDDAMKEFINKVIIPGAEQIKKPERVICLWKSCKCNPIKSHSQTKMYLKNIAVEGLVYRFLPHYFANEFINTDSIRRASRFYGFCEEHDNNCFSIIEKEGIDEMNTEKAFLILYRTLCLEVYKKGIRAAKQKFIIKKLKQCTASTIHERKHKRQLLRFFNDTQRGVQHFINYEFKEFKKLFDNMEVSEDFDAIDFRHANLSQQLPISIAAIINPMFDAYIPGNDLQPIFCLNIIPNEKTTDIILIWLKKHANYMNKIIDFYESDLEKFINIMCFLESEEVLISPTFWENLTENEQRNIIESMSLSHLTEKRKYWDQFPSFIKLSHPLKI